MNFCKEAISNFVDALKQYVKFEGKANRKQFWMFVLVSVILSSILGVIWKPLEIIFFLAILIPSLAIGARRLHDINKSGWLQLIMLIPVIGALILIFGFWIKPGVKDEAPSAPADNA